MRLITFIIIVMLLIVASMATLILVKHSLKSDKEIKLSSFYVKAYDAVTNKLIETDFLVVSNNTIQAKGRTNIHGWEEVKIREDLREKYNIYVLNYGSGYYVNRFLTTDKYAILSLYKIYSPNITLVSFNETNILLNLTLDKGQYRQIGFCLKWSGNILDVSSNNFSLILPPKRLEGKVEKCYYTYYTLIPNASLPILLSYKLIDKLGEYDEIEVIFFDSDRNYLNQYTIEGENGEDVGGEDIRFLIGTLCSGGKCYFTQQKCESSFCEV